jgi:hypothetical protein
VIVISGALLVIAVVFLGIGLYGSLGWVYASIVVSFLAFVFMLVALRQQRNAAADEPAPPVHPLGLTKRPAPDAATDTDPADSDVTLVTPAPAQATPSDDEPDAAAVPTASPDVPLVPATRKSAAKKATATTSAAKKAAPAKKAAAPRKAAPRKSAAKKTAAPDAEPSTQLAMTDDAAEPTEPSEG